MLDETSNEIILRETDTLPLVERAINGVRDEVRDNPYIAEAMKVLKAGGLRSTIGCFWNAVVDDLRNKVIHRSLPLFNKSMPHLRRQISSYEDFQDHVNDDELVEGAYKVGVITWETSKVLRHAKETRHLFDGHPRSSQPSMIKVLSMMDDCIKYVLNVEYPPQIIDIDNYIAGLGNSTFDRNKIAIESAIGDLPEVYKNELSHRLFSAYLHEQSSTTLKGNIEFVMPTLWVVLPKKVKLEIVRRLDRSIADGDTHKIRTGFEFIDLVDANKYLSITARRYKIEPLIQKLTEKLDDWDEENECVKALQPYAGLVPEDLTDKYVSALTHTYIGYTGSSRSFSRTDFYADAAANRIPQMFEQFDERSAAAFINCIRTSETLRRRVRNANKLRRLRSLSNIVSERVTERFPDNAFLEMLNDETRENEIFRELAVGTDL